ncbi:cell division protein ZapA [Mesonia ostreae]|uniref:Cell division protein ZapA n=1 Tax=Mesonia ostreae TaxID=861110 RepID=A0ABU2KKI0_9FLAO|nr:cell division protein ZapA [Mesonia ostreae]MDT0295189.1 cell division protein ZapA [Mesonia ostreae]
MSNDKLKIKLSIADRIYPLTIAPSQEEGLRKAAKKIEEVIKQYEQSYAVRDKQDVLAMCALQFASKTEQHSINNDKEVIDARQKLSDLVAVLDDHLT